jgi:peptide/nickel transport system substrate-binding protein
MAQVTQYHVGRLAILVAAAASIVLATAGAGSSAASTPHLKAAGTTKVDLTIVNETGGNWTCDFNPFNPSGAAQSVGVIYEPLAFVNTLKSGMATSWLAKSWSWSARNKVLTFTIRQGVKFSDGKPLTAADVAFTFNLMKRHPALDVNGVWSVLSKVAAPGSGKVVMTFKSPAVPYFYDIADRVGIVPKAIWSRIAHPVTYPDVHPIGTGPFTVGTCTPQVILYKARARYWQPGLPKVKTVGYPAFLNNDTANAFLANGQGQWGSQFIPDIRRLYVAPDPKHRHYWFPPVANNSVFINQTNRILRNVAVRRAMAYAINRSAVSSVAEFGYEPASNQTGIVTPTFTRWLDRPQARRYGNDYAYRPATATRILTAAGFRRGADGIFEKAGKKLSFTIINDGPLSDWVAALNVISSELKIVGIRLTPRNLGPVAYYNDLHAGRFQLAYASETGGPGPFYELRELLFSGDSARIGKPARSNFERYASRATDALIKAYSATTDAATQKRIVDKLQLVMLKDVPVIPVFESVDWYEYDTTSFTGWPTPRNQYAQPSIYNYPDWEQVLLRLVPKR